MCDDTVAIYDSWAHSRYLPNAEDRNPIALLQRDAKGEVLKVKVANVTGQDNFWRCGLFACRYATVIVLNQDPALESYGVRQLDKHIEKAVDQSA